MAPDEPWTELARARAPAGEPLVLRRRGDEFEIRCGGWELMSNRAHHSEQALGQLACAGLGVSAHVLLAGLGMGYTLRAALDVLAPGARVTVAEIIPEVVAWNRGPLAPLADRPLEDARVTVHPADVATLLHRAAYDAILLDIDNGPNAAMLAGNAALYEAEGLHRLRRALRPNGSLAIWSADPSPTFAARLTACGFDWRATDVPARGAEGDPLHTLYLAAPAQH